MGRAQVVTMPEAAYFQGVIDDEQRDTARRIVGRILELAEAGTPLPPIRPPPLFGPGMSSVPHQILSALFGLVLPVCRLPPPVFCFFLWEGGPRL